MNLHHYQTLLLARQNELTQDIHRFDADVRNAPTDEVGDRIDVATYDESKSVTADLSSTAEAELVLVQDALKRIENGTYGKCIECGETIPTARLDAIPWASFCLKDQAAHDTAQGFTHAATL